MSPGELRQIIAANVRSRRLELGLTQQAVAEAVGLTQSRIAQIERGFAAVPSDLLALLATALNTAPAMLLTDGAFVSSPQRKISVA